MRLSGLTYDSPRAFTFRQKAVLWTVPRLVAGVLKSLERTCHHEIRGQHYWDDLMASHGRILLAFWHESVGLAAFRYRNSGFHTLTSYSFDGELAARVVERFGLRALRGSSSRGGVRALHDLRIALEQAHGIGFTLDGPRGPRRVAKPGIAMIAAQTQTPILPHAFAVAPAWRLESSWDRIPIPKPFAKVVSEYGPPIPPPKTASSDAIETTRKAVEDALNAMHARLESELGIPAFGKGQ